MTKIAFIAIAIAFSIFYGRKAVSIFVDTENCKIMEKMKLRSWRFHQFWLNFVGSLIGWAAAYYLIFCRILPLSNFLFKIEDTVPIIIAVLGITGLLPYTLSKLTSIK